MEKSNLDEEFSQEFSDLKWQFENMQQILSNLEKTIDQASKHENGDEEEKREFSSQFRQEEGKKGRSGEMDSKKGNEKEEGRHNQSGSSSNSTNPIKLSSQIQDFIKQTQMQQSSVQQELQKSIQEAIDILNQANVQIQTNQALISMNNSINQAEQQINFLSGSTSANQNKKPMQTQQNRPQQSQNPQGQEHQSREHSQFH